MNHEQTPEINADILVVDDNLDNLRLLSNLLIRQGYHVRPVSQGAKAVTAAQIKPPDLILLDILMPEMDGYEVCQQLKAGERTREIPIIFISALSETFDIVKAFNMGGVDYITKPFQPEEVLARVKTHLTLRHVQIQLQIKNQQLAELNASKDKFFSIMAHDLKNPLIAFLSFASLLEHLHQLEEGEMVDLIRRFRSSAEHLFALLENLLTWSRMQRGMITCLPEYIEVEELIERNIALLKLNAEQKQITLRSSIAEKIRIYADFNMVDTVIRNLLSNGIKFTETGGSIKISATHEQDAVTITVADTGIGIPEEKMAQLFRIDAAYQRAGTAGEKGTGLGLILCKEFVDQNNGIIQVESIVGKGTTVRVTLPNGPKERKAFSEKLQESRISRDQE